MSPERAVPEDLERGATLKSHHEHHPDTKYAHRLPYGGIVFGNGITVRRVHYPSLRSTPLLKSWPLTGTKPAGISDDSPSTPV